MSLILQMSLISSQRPSQRTVGALAHRGQKILYRQFLRCLQFSQILTALQKHRRLMKLPPCSLTV